MTDTIRSDGATEESAQADVTTIEHPSEDIGMRVLTKDLQGWEDAWLVELDEPIRPDLRSYEHYESGVVVLAEVDPPPVPHVVVNRVHVRDDFHETLVYPAFASGAVRRLDQGMEPIAGGDACTHVDALHDLAEGFVGVECTVDGERCPYAMGRNRLLRGVE